MTNQGQNSSQRRNSRKIFFFLLAVAVAALFIFAKDGIAGFMQEEKMLAEEAASYTSTKSVSNLESDKACVGKAERKLVSAYHELAWYKFAGGYGLVMFQPTVQLNWEALVQPVWRAVDIKSPTAEFLSMLKREKNKLTGDAAFHHDSSLELPCLEGFYYFISPEGIDPLELKSARSTVTFGLNNDGTEIVNRSYYGSLIGAVAGDRALGDGGFVLYSEKPLEFHKQESSLKADTIIPGKNLLGYNIDSQFIFKTDEDDTSYLFINWGDDSCLGACCMYWYELFVSDGEGYKPLHGNAYGCSD